MVVKVSRELVDDFRFLSSLDLPGDVEEGDVVECKVVVMVASTCWDVSGSPRSMRKTNHW